jgi:hypothetical protein
MKKALLALSAVVCLFYGNATERPIFILLGGILAIITLIWTIREIDGEPL